MVTLIYCAAGNKRYADIALKYGFRYGAQLPHTIYHPPYFADQDWKKPDRAKYMAALARHRPALATVLDYERDDQHEEVMSWAEEAAQYVSEAVIVIPKAQGSIARIPECIGGKRVRLGYSVPTKYGGTSVPVWDFGRREVHLLGGSPQEQHRLAGMLNVKSADGNYIAKMSNRYNQFFSAGKMQAKNAHFPKLDESVFGYVQLDAPYLAFELSVMNMRALWAGCRATIRLAVQEDLQHIKKIANQYKQELGYVMYPALRESMARENLLVATYQDRVVGFVNYRACRDGWQTVYEIAVDKTRRGEHIGAGLLSAVPQPIRLKCTLDNPANEFYQSQGFQHVRVEAGRKRQLNIWHLPKDTI
jgi:N-acetylglutamate synthase-like GNAT family acetyltransferase